MSTPMIGFDTETALIGRGRKAPPLVCYSITDHRGTHLYRWDDRREILLLWERAALGECIIVGANTSFDALVTANAFPGSIETIFKAYEKGCVSDVLIRETLLRLEDFGEPRRFTLNDLTEFYFQETLNKGSDSWRLKYWDLRDTPIRDWPEDAVSYAKGDTSLLIDIVRKQENKKQHEDTFFDEPAQTRAGLALALMASWGLRVDLDYLHSLQRSLRDTKEGALDLLCNQVVDYERTNKGKIVWDRGPIAKMDRKGRPTGSLSRQAMASYLESQNIDLPKTPTGRPSLAAENLLGVEDPVVRAYSDYKTTDKLLNTYLSKYEDGLVQCSVNLILANGRNSLANPSLQNVPRGKGIREAFIPRPGRVFGSIDYDGVELRTLAESCLELVGYSRMAETFQMNPAADLHSHFAAAMVGESVEYILKHKNEGGHQASKARQDAKAANFGFPGGMGIDTFIESQRKAGTIYSEKQAMKLKSMYIKQWPEMKPYFEHVTALLDSQTGTGTMKTLVSGRYRGESGFCQIANGFFSSLMADGAKASTFEIQRQCYAVRTSPIYGARVVNSVHDEVLAEFDESGAHEQSLHMAEIFCDVMHSNYTPRIPITAEPALMRRWYKNAKPVYDSSGRLTPWEPKTWK